MTPAEKLQAAAERGEMVLNDYDSDPRQRYFRIMVDLSAQAEADGIDLRRVAVYAAARIEVWQSGVNG